MSKLETRLYKSILYYLDKHNKKWNYSAVWITWPLVPKLHATVNKSCKSRESRPFTSPRWTGSTNVLVCVYFQATDLNNQRARLFLLFCYGTSALNGLRFIIFSGQWGAIRMQFREGLDWHFISRSPIFQSMSLLKKWLIALWRCQELILVNNIKRGSTFSSSIKLKQRITYNAKLYLDRRETDLSVGLYKGL